MTGWCFEPETPLIFNDVAEVIPITAVVTYDAILGDVSSHIMLI
jgi:hypothetical protein